MNKRGGIINFGIIGGGSWGTAIACHGARVLGSSEIYARDEEIVLDINDNHLNSKYLGDIILPPKLKATSDFVKLVKESDILVIATPSYSFTETLEELKSAGINENTIILIATKGIANDPVELFSSRIKKILPNQFGFISGPNLAKEIAEGKFAAITISSENLEMAKYIAGLLESDNCEVTVNCDIITIQIAAVVKNITAIKSGMMDAANAGENAKAWLITKAYQEIALISSALGSDNSAMLEPAVIGDLVLTSYSVSSRNNKFGYEFHKSGYTKSFLKDYPALVEGLEGAKLIKQLTSRYNLDLPIIDSVIKMVV